MRPINADELRDIYSSVPNGVYTTSHIVTAIDECKTVDTIPLDRMCERLVNFSECPSCAECKLYGFTCGEYGPCGSKEHWMAVLTKWMEGLDAADRH